MNTQIGKPIKARTKMNDCFFCDHTGVYQVGVSDFQKKNNAYVGDACLEHVPNAINQLMPQLFATRSWPVVATQQGEILYHTYDANKKGLSAVMGWKELVASIEKKTKR